MEFRDFLEIVQRHLIRLIGFLIVKGFRGNDCTKTSLCMQEIFVFTCRSHRISCVISAGGNLGSTQRHLMRFLGSHTTDRFVSKMYKKCLCLQETMYVEL